MSVRINKFVAQVTGLSRRAADEVIMSGRVQINQKTASLGDKVEPHDQVTLDNNPIKHKVSTMTIMLNKPRGYVCSRNGQGSSTVYDLLPKEYHHLKFVGRLDKDSSGLLLLTNDGELANQLTHPKFSKIKVYEIELDKPLKPLHQQMISDHGINLSDGNSRLQLEKSQSNKHWRVTMQEGRNRQIRRTFAALGYNVAELHRISLGVYSLDGLEASKYRMVET